MIVSLPDEIWKPIAGFEGLYEVSNKGRIKALRKTWISGKNGVTTRTKEEAIIGQANSHGYKHSVLTKNGIQRAYGVHRIIASAFIPNPENKLNINHKNGIKNDNRIENLEWATDSENTQHAYDNGLAKGKKRGDHSRARKIKCETFDYVFDCIADACDALGISDWTMYSILKGTAKVPSGLSFRYIN